MIMLKRKQYTALELLQRKQLKAMRFACAMVLKPLTTNGQIYAGMGVAQ